MPTVVRSVPAVTSNKYAVISPSSEMDSSLLMAASSPQCLSASTFPDSDTGYFGSFGLYEGSCDHLDYDYDRRYSVELTDDTDVFTENANVACSQIPFDSYVTVTCSESQNAVPNRSKQLETSNKEQLDVGVASVDANLQSGRSVPLDEQCNNVAATNLSDYSQNVYFPTTVTVPDKMPAADAIGLSEVTGKYTTVQLLLEMNRQRAGLASAENLSLDQLPTGYQSSTCLDREALASLATNYCVINECIQIGRAMSKHGGSGDSKTLTSECADVVLEQPQAVEVRDFSYADNITPVKDLGASLPYDDPIRKDASPVASDTKQVGESVTTVSHETDASKFDDSKPVVSVSQSEMCLMYMDSEDPYYYPVYSRLRDVETGIFNTYLRVSDNAEVKGGCTTEKAAAIEHEEMQVNISDTRVEKADSVRYATDSATHLDPIIYHPELSVVHYNSLASLGDVESGNMLAAYMPAHRAADGRSTVSPHIVGKTSSKRKNGKQIDILKTDAVNYNAENQELSDEDRCEQAALDDDSHSDSFTVVETKKHRRQRKKLDFEYPATQNSSLSMSPTSINESRSATMQCSNGDAEEMHTAEPFVLSEAEESMFAQGLTPESGTEECLIQNSLVEDNPCIDEITAVPIVDLGIKTVPLVQTAVTEEVVTGMVPDVDGPQRSEPVEAPVPISTLPADSAAKQETVAEVGHHFSDVVLSDMETLPISVIDDEGKNQDLLLHEIPTCVAIEPEFREQIDNVKSTIDDVAGMTVMNVRNVALEPQATAVDMLPVLAFVKQRAAPDPLTSAPNETVRVERLITVAPRSVVRVSVDLCAGKDIIDVASSEEPPVITISLAQVELESDVSTIQKSTYEPSQAAVECDQALTEENIEATAAVSDDRKIRNPPTQLDDRELQVTLSEFVVDKAVVEVAGYSDTTASETDTAAEFINALPEGNVAENEVNLYEELGREKEETAESSESVKAVYNVADTAECTGTMKTLTEVETEPERAVEIVEQVEADHNTEVIAVSEMNEKEVCETVNSLNLSAISQSADVDQIVLETKISNVSCMPCDEVLAERCVAHYASLAVLGDVESGTVHNKLKASRFLREWGAENVDDIVAYIVGSEAKKHRRKHKHVKRTSESEVSEIKARESDSEIMTVSMLHAKSEENISWVDEQPEEPEAVASDAEDQSISEPGDDTESGCFTVVENRKHRRQRHRHDAEEMWAQYLDDVDDVGPVSEECEVESLHGLDYNDAETVLESLPGSSDANGVIAIAMSDETIIEVSPDDGKLDTVHDALKVVTTGLLAEYATETQATGELILERERDAKLDSLVEDADVHISAGICEPAAESTVEVVLQPLFEVEIDRDVNAEFVHPAAVNHSLQDGSVPMKAAELAQDVTLEPTLPVSGGCVAEGRLYSDVARGKYDVDVVAKPQRETPPTDDIEVSIGMDVKAMPIEALDATSAELPAESVEDVCPKLTLEACQLSSEVPVSSSVTETSPVMIAGDVGEFVSERVEDVQAEPLSEITSLSNTCDVTWPGAETTEKLAHPTKNSLELPFTKGPVELDSSEPALEQQQKAVSEVEESVPVDDLKSDVELSAAEYDVAVPELSDVQTLASCCYLQGDENLVEPSTAELDIESLESRVLISLTEVPDVGTVLEATYKSFDQQPFAENFELSSSRLTEASVEPVVELSGVELPAVELQSTEFAVKEPGIPTSAGEAASKTLLYASDAESTNEPMVELPVADVPVLGYEAAAAEDEQLVADLFSEGARAVRIRSDLAPATGIVTANEAVKPMPDSQVEITVTRTHRRSEDALKNSALSSVESFTAEILPYYYAALAILGEVERDTSHLLSLHTVGETYVKMSHGILKTSDGGDFTASSGDQELSDTAVPVETSLEMESAAEKGGMPETDLNIISQSRQSAVPLSDHLSEQSTQLVSEIIQPSAGKCLQSGLQMGSTVATSDKHLLGQHHTDVVAMQCHYQSLKLLHSVETGDLPVFSLELVTSSDRSFIITEEAPAILPTEESTDTLTFSPVDEAQRPRHDISKDVSLEVDDIDTYVFAENQDLPTVSSRPASSNFPAAEDLTPVVSSAEHYDVEISGADDFAKVPQSIPEDRAEREDSNMNDADVVSSEGDHDTSFSNLLIKEPTDELPVQTAENVIEVSAEGTQPNASSLHDGRGDRNISCVVNNAVDATGDSLQSPVSVNQFSLPEESVSSDLTEELLPNICLRELSPQQQQQHSDARQMATEQHANQDASCFNEQPLGKEDIKVPMSSDSKTFTIQELPEEETKKKRKKRKKKTKSPKDDLTHQEGSPGCSDLQSVNQSKNFKETVCRTSSPATTEARNFDNSSLQISTLVISEAPDGIASSSPKKNKKRKRTKKAGKAVADNMAMDNSVNENTNALPAAVSEPEQNNVNGVEVSNCISEETNENSLFLVAETTVQQDEVEAFRETATADSCHENRNSQQSVLQSLDMSCSDTTGLPSTTSDGIAVGFEPFDSTLNAEESVPSVSPADVTARPTEEGVNVEKPVELCTQTVDAELSDNKFSSSTKPAKKKNRKKRKPKTNTVPSPDTSAVIDGEVDKAYDSSVLLDSLVENQEQQDISIVTEPEEIMTESLEEDAKITEQPLEILSMDETKVMSDPSLHYLCPLVSKTAGKKKKKRKAKTSKVVQPCTTVGYSSDFVTESLPEAKDDLPEKYEITDETPASNFTSESAPTDRPTLAATLSLTTGQLDNTNASMSVSREDEWKRAETETQFEIDSNDESSLDEYQYVSHTTEQAADSTTVSGDSENRKKKRKRNMQKKVSMKNTCSGAETDADLCSLLTRIIEICVETKDSQAGDSGNQPQSSKSEKHDTNASHAAVQAPKDARKPRKYKRSKPIRLPPDVGEQPPEVISTDADTTSADTVAFSTHALQSSDTQHLTMRSATQIPEETRSDFHESLKFPESPSNLISTESVADLSDTTVADDPTMTQNVEETHTIIAWSASVSKMSDRPTSFEYPGHRSLPDSVFTDTREGQQTEMSDFAVRRTQNIEDTVAGSDCPLDVKQTELQETCLDDEPRLTSDGFQDSVNNQTNSLNLAGCLTTDVFSVISQDTNVDEASETMNFSSEPNDDIDIIKPLTRITENQLLPDADNSVGVTEQNSNHCSFDGDGLLQAPTSGCETSSVDSEVERIFAGHMACDADDGLSFIGESVCSDSGKDADDDLALADDDVVITEYLDVEIIEETETITVLDNDDDLSPSVSGRRFLDIDDTPPGSKSTIPSISSHHSSGRVKDTTEGAVPFQPYSFRLHDPPSHDNAEKIKMPAISTKDASVRDNRGQKFSPQWFGKYSATEDRTAVHWPPTSEEHAAKLDVTEVPGLRRFSRKRQYPSDDTISSESGDDKQGSDGSQIVLAQHQPASAEERFAPVWPFLASDTQWSTSDDVIDVAFADTLFGEQNPATEMQVTAKPLIRPRQNAAAAVPTDFDLQDGSNLVRREKDCSQDEEELSGDSLNEDSSVAVGGFFRELETSLRTTVSSGAAQTGFGETWESCSTDSLDYQTKIGRVIDPYDCRRSSTDCISEDSLAESSFVDREDSGVSKYMTAVPSTKNATTVSTQAAGEQGQDTGRYRVSAKPKKFRGVSAKFKYPKPGVAVKTSRKRKLGNVAKDGSDGGETDTDSNELE